MKKFIRSFLLSIVSFTMLMVPVSAEEPQDISSTKNNVDTIITESLIDGEIIKEVNIVNNTLTPNENSQTSIMPRSVRYTNNHETVKLIFKDNYRRKLTSAFGEIGNGRQNPHDGVDYGTDVGENLYAIDSNALVTGMQYGITTSWTKSSGTDQDYGNYVMYYLPKYNVTILYAHLQAGTIYVDTGVTYSTSTIFAKAGNTGLSGGPHLHVGLANGKQSTMSGFKNNKRDFEAFKLNGSSGNTEDFVRVPETGYRFYPDRNVNVRDYPSRSGNIMAVYYSGESFAYDSYVVNDGHIWLSYVSASGHRRYVAWRVQNGEKFGVIK